MKTILPPHMALLDMNMMACSVEELVEERLDLPVAGQTYFQKGIMDSLLSQCQGTDVWAMASTSFS
eukprot:527837-Amphidinium_carterae.1